MIHHLVIYCELSIIIRNILVFEIRTNLDLRKILVTPKIFLKSRLHCTKNGAETGQGRWWIELPACCWEADTELKFGSSWRWQWQWRWQRWLQGSVEKRHKKNSALSLDSQLLFWIQIINNFEDWIINMMKLVFVLFFAIILISRYVLINDLMILLPI